MMRFLIVLFTCSLVHTVLMAQYAPQAGVSGSTAISKNSGRFTGWATGCVVKHGYMNIADPLLGLANSGDATMATGMPDNGPVSLGDSGVAVLTFSHPIYNGNGPDFAVFENGFPDPQNPEMSFMELAFVEVSSDGVNYFRFPASCQIPLTSQVPMAGVYSNARHVHNLAGKYIGGYGTPFDLDELKHHSGLDVDNITHIRIVDVVGDITTHTSADKNGNVINDPYPTPIPTGGFDLDAVGALFQHGLFPVSVDGYLNKPASIYPNPVSDRLQIAVAADGMSATLVDATGALLANIPLQNGHTEMPFSQYAPGVYFIIVTDKQGQKWTERVSKF